MSRPSILDRVADQGFVVFENGQCNLNIIGVRSSGRVANTFDDKMHVVFKNSNDEWVELIFTITTDPGNYWLENPSRVAGTAILCRGQYRGVYQIGKHRNKYEALVQRRKVRVYRDSNKNEVLDINPASSSSEEGFFGINIHRANASRESTSVEKWSAGCQVFANPYEYGIFMALCHYSARLYGNSFTYTLLEDMQIP